MIDMYRAAMLRLLSLHREHNSVDPFRNDRTVGSFKFRLLKIDSLGQVGQLAGFMLGPNDPKHMNIFGARATNLLSGPAAVEVSRVPSITITSESHRRCQSTS